MSDIQDRSNYFSIQYDNNALARDLIDGLASMRGFVVPKATGAYRSIYLPQMPEEPDDIYRMRLSRSYLTNYAKRAITSDSGKILANRVSINGVDNSDLPEEYEYWLDDIDLQGMDVQTFASNALQSAMWKGVTLAFADCIKDEVTGEFRPFIRPIDIDDVLEFKANKVTGRLVFMRFASQMEDDSDDSQFSSEFKNCIFEIEPTEWRAYDLDDDGLALDEPFAFGEIVRYKDGTKRITNEIPVSIMYTNKQGFLIAESPYQTLMELTVEHFQVNSEIKNAETYALQPILFGKDLPEGFQMKAIASYRGIFVEYQGKDANADLKWVETDTDAINQARQGLKDLESRITTFSIDANSIRPSGNVTATERSIDAAGSNAALRAFAQALAPFIDKCITMMSSYTLNPIEIEVDVRPDFTLSDNLETTKTLIEMKKEGIISKKAVVDESINNKTLSKEFDYDADQAQIELERMNSETEAPQASQTGEVVDYTTNETAIITEEASQA